MGYTFLENKTENHGKCAIAYSIIIGIFYFKKA